MIALPHIFLALLLIRISISNPHAPMTVPQDSGSAPQSPSFLQALFPYQKEWVNDASRFKILLASRQVGKSFSSVVEAVRDCLAHPGSTWLILSSGDRQSQEAFQKAREFADLFDDLLKSYREDLTTPVKKTRKGEIRWSNGSRLLAIPANPSTARGYSANIVLDEFAFHQDSNAIWRSLYPSISNPLKGTFKVRVMSTPNGRQNAFFDLWTKNNQKASVRSRYQKHLVTIHQAVAQGLCGSLDPKEFIEELRDGLGDQTAWEQEFECNFTNGQETLLSYDSILQAESPLASIDNTNYLTEKCGPIFCGIDYGRMVDPTVCWVLEQVGDVLWTREVLVLRETNTVFQNEILRPRVLRSTRTAVDSTGPGVGFGDYLANGASEKVDLCHFSPAFKRLLFPRLARRFQPPVSIRIPACAEVREDLHGIQQCFTNGDFHYEARRSKTGHSDRAIALALAIHAATGASPAPIPAQFRVPQQPGRIALTTQFRRNRKMVGYPTYKKTQPQEQQMSPFHQPLQVARAEKWREYLNPLIGLNIQTIIARLQASQIGIVSDLQWLYRFIERRDATLSSLITRRTSAILELDWNIKQTPENRLPAGFSAKEAELQAQALGAAYNEIDNLNEALGWLAMATFRGYAHLEIHLGANDQIAHLEPVPQWNWARDGLFGRWCYNPRALSVVAGSPDTVEIDPAHFVIRECSSAVNEIAAICFIRKNMSQKDWDAFVEIYGLPPLFIELPPDVPVDQMSTYQTMAESIMTDSRGVLPNGAKVQTIDNGAKGRPPFADHIRYQDEQVVLAGTGGLLTMLTESGSGTLAGNAHTDSFQAIAAAEARQISQCLQRQLDALILEKLFPNQPRLAYFELAQRIASDPAQVVSDVEQLARAGVQVSLAEVAEKSGYTDLSDRPPVDKTVERAFAGDNTQP